jgi:hypothetical protein
MTASSSTTSADGLLLSCITCDDGIATPKIAVSLIRNHDQYVVPVASICTHRSLVKDAALATADDAKITQMFTMDYNYS